jgi:hypothetical protein
LAAEVLEERHAVAEQGEPDVGGDGPDMLAAERLLRMKSSTLARVADPRERRRRAYALLARNGFDPETCREATLSLAAPATPEDEA